MAQLTWQGTQTFASRGAAVRAANATMRQVDPDRPNLRWIASDLHLRVAIDGTPVVTDYPWELTHYSYRLDGLGVHDVG